MLEASACRDALVQLGQPLHCLALPQPRSAVAKAVQLGSPYASA